MPTALSESLEYIADVTDTQSLIRLSCAIDFSATVLDSPNEHWIQLTPKDLVTARDGRTFRFNDLAAICQRTELPLLVDNDHVSEKPDGTSRASGWIEELWADETGDRFGTPGIYGRVKWTPKGLSDVSTLEYRFISPVLLCTTADSEALQLISVALTNSPALVMSAIDQVKARFTKTNLTSGKGNRMIDENLKVLCRSLDLAEDADDTQIVEASSQLRAQCATLTAELQEARTSASSAQAELAQLKEATFKAEVDAVLAQASKEGRVTPALASKYREFCSDSKTLAFFKDTILPSLPALCESAPKSVAGSDDSLPDSPVIESLKSQGMSESQIKQALAHNRKNKRGLVTTLED